MKIQCDVCNKEEASVFCSADEAALCSACDHSVHHANKLAGKHQRFSLLQPPPKQVPLCDICQERRAFLFCQQDRAILCRECDIPIHKANEHTQKHNRFLLTGVKLSGTSALYSPSASSSLASITKTTTACDAVPSVKPPNSMSKPTSGPSEFLTPPSIPKITISRTTTAIATSATGDKGGLNNQLAIEWGGGSTSSISEYLTEMLPEWHFQDFLDSSATIPYGFCKTTDDEVSSFWNAADFERNLNYFSSENMGIRVPQAPPPSLPSQLYSSNMTFGDQIGFKEFKEVTNSKSSNRWRDDGCLTVPQIRTPPASKKRVGNF